MAGSEEVSLFELMSQHFAFQILGACLVVILYVLYRKKVGQTGLKVGVSFKGWIFIYPLAMILFGLALCFSLGLHINDSFILLLINTLMVGFSEELMFRGILLSELSRRMSFWKAAIIMSLMFGAVHLFNAVVTGEVGMGLIQAVTATMSGFLFLGIRLKTNSIWPAMIVHGLWDFAILVNSAENGVNMSENMVAMIFGLFLLIGPLVNFVTGIIQCKNKGLVRQYMEEQK